VRILLVEYWHSHIYGEPFFARLRELGEEVFAFKEHEYLARSERPGVLGRIESASVRAQNKFRWGPRLTRMNRALVSRAKDLRPDIMFLFRGTHVLPETISRIKELGIYVAGWNNDDPFGVKYPYYVWRHFRRSIPLYDRLYAYRYANVEDFRRTGCERVGLLRSFYLRELNCPVDSSGSPYQCDVSFIGHWEADGRSAYVASLLRMPRIAFRLWGTLWERSPDWSDIRVRFGTIQPLYKEKYNLAINSSSISLVFLSGLNNDTYTRRCFEIPAAGTFMLSQHSEDMESLFREGIEAAYFRSPEEMKDKIRFYLGHRSERERISARGRQRLLRDGHEALDRARQVVGHLRQDLAELRDHASSASSAHA